jgi:transcriptional regulator with XRE-family HTH domain
MMQSSLARKLRVLRAERGLTQRAASAQIGVTKETLSDLERGLRHPHDVTLSRIARGYGVPVEELLEEPALASKAEAPPETGPAEAKGPDPSVWGPEESRPKPSMPGTAGEHSGVNITDSLGDEEAHVEVIRTAYLDLFRKVREGQLSPEEATDRAMEELTA